MLVIKILVAIVLFVVIFRWSMKCAIVRKAKRPHELLKVKWDETVGEIYKNLPYKNDYGNTYDLYIPKEIDRQKEQGFILYIHGGSFTGGQKEDCEPWCRFFASKGYITATMDYTLNNKEHKSNLNLMVEEIGHCVEAVKEDCDKKGIGVTKVALSGTSAGGCLAMLYAYREKERHTIPVTFLFQMTGPARFQPKDWKVEENNKKIAEFVEALVGKTITEDMVDTGEINAYIDEISPCAHVKNDTVFSLFAYGPKDKIVPPELKYYLFEAFAKEKANYEYIEFSNSNHMMYSDLDKTKEYIDKSLFYLDKYIG